MNTNNIKSYAPKARQDFIAAITKQAAKYGITAKAITPLEKKGDVALIGDRTFPVSIITPRAALVKKVEQLGFQQVIEQVAYSWFNRLCAIRFMELKDYLGHGLRVLSHPEQKDGFQILEDCLDVDLHSLGKNLDHSWVRDLKLDGTKDEELYRELLLAQCHALHQAMPFLFEAIDDETELLLPENLTKTDSLIRELVEAIPEADWQDVEIIGWLYQFYISEKKDQVIGKVVKSEDIPAATQLFTPNWIVKYMVHNSLGAQWLATYPDSPLKEQMDYYIEPAEQTDEVNAQLKAITPDTLNPEELTLIDPASGSGHILVEAYELFKAIYLERGYRQRDVAQLILEKNLFGLDIDGRAAQLTGFALMMKGRADDRRLFERGLKLNVMALVDSTGFDAEVLVSLLPLHSQEQPRHSREGVNLELTDLNSLKELFEHATTFGSLIQVPEELAEKLPALKKLSEATSQDLFVSEALKRLGPLVQLAELLAAQYDAVVANPPYMGNIYLNGILKKYLKDSYDGASADLFSAFVTRCCAMGSNEARIGMMTPNVWMYLPTHEELRRFISTGRTLKTLVELPLSGFKGATVQICAFALWNARIPNAKGCFIRLVDAKGADTEMAACTIEAIQDHDCGWYFEANQDEFNQIPGSPVAYWVSEQLRLAFSRGKPLLEVSEARRGVETGNNEKFLRQWQEVSKENLGISRANSNIEETWYPYNKGGGFKKWYGNRWLVINWRNSGHDIKNQSYPKGSRLPWRAANEAWYFKDGLTWGGLTSGAVTFRLCDYGAVFDSNKGSMMFPQERDRLLILALLNTDVVHRFLKILNPTVSTQKDDIGNVPFIEPTLVSRSRLIKVADRCVELAKIDEQSNESSWDFQCLPLLAANTEPTPTLESSYTAWITQNRETIAEMKRLEEENNRLFIDVYGLGEELTPEVPIEQITLTVSPAYRYGGKLTKEQLWTRFRQDTMEELVSYAIGCMVGRYSLDEPGLIYAHSGNEGFDASRYPSFPADDDGIIPLTDKEWFADDAANRLVEFMAVAWDAAQLEENLAFLADNLSPKKGEGSRDTLRRYLCDSFYKDHMKIYKKRPIYWLFSSGKQKAFQCLVYLHRYNESTLARMRTEYVIPLTAKLSTHVEKLEQDKEASSSTAEIKKLEKEITQLHKQQAELSTFDEKLRHYADQRITLDLDDGVKVNYGKFGDLLAEVKAITGEKPKT